MKHFKSGKSVKQTGGYSSFEPVKINRQWNIDDADVQSLLSLADRQIGRLDMYSDYVPNIDLFIRMHVVKEATLSSKIEGTRTNVEEALMQKQNIAEEKRDDWEEVHNYIEAMNQAIAQLTNLPFSTRLIKLSHKILLQGVRGEHKQPGEFRNSQNWIGGASLNDAIFIPPAHHSIAELMSDLEKFVHNHELKVPDLIKVALIHYQFETIHPFLDGNGRVGRLMITLYLVSKGIIQKPILYLSAFFEKNRMLYYDNLTRVRTQNDLNQWLKFFLTGVIETAKSSVETFKAVLALKEKTEKKILGMRSRVANAQVLLENLYTNPIIDAKMASEVIGKSLPTTYKLLSDLKKLDILAEMKEKQRDKIYHFKEYIELFK
ncbi:MAG: Fic family protein [Bacteroidia bacterium]